MSKDKLHIPMPDEQFIKQQVQKIVSEGVNQKESFFSFLKSMYKQVGLRHLFSNQVELVFTIITAITFLSFYLLNSSNNELKTEDLYANIFLFSPLAFLAYSLFTYTSKVMNTTFEVEMTCKYNVYQIIAFRMLTFSVVSILINTISIVFMALSYENLDFLRAFMISTSGLFMFSLLFLFVLMRKHSLYSMLTLAAAWLIGNVMLNTTNNELYTEALMQLPLFVYGIVFVCAAFFNLRFLNKLIYFKQKEGAY